MEGDTGATEDRSNYRQRPGQFPVPMAREFPISVDATRYYKSGTSFAYRYLAFWVATLFSRTVVGLLPTLLVVIPALRCPGRTQNRSTYCANTFNSFGKISLDRR
jgi:hypothetical protein